MDVLLVQHRRRISARSPIGELYELNIVWAVERNILQCYRRDIFARLRTELGAIWDHEHYGAVRDPRWNGYLGLASKHFLQGLHQRLL